ncbi:hypothetical protein Salat_2273100 [Sesamum alatum]|uniref:Uncharacterized protein n=1 Tax=Sesamum alatum TaxID=300844 RepID=A0AAE1XW25_9LAMI|nr:hypothetical protein Salat_2273100 [Sesamum alatum]
MEARRSYRNLWHASLMRTPLDDPTLAHVSHICCENVLSGVICPDMNVVEGTCPVVVNVEKVNVLNFVFALRFSSALTIQWLRPDLCCRMSSTYKRQNATIASLEQ